jgi:3-keto-disaccharide hydrolase
MTNAFSTVVLHVLVGRPATGAVEDVVAAPCVARCRGAFAVGGCGSGAGTDASAGDAAIAARGGTGGGAGRTAAGGETASGAKDGGAIAAGGANARSGGYSGGVAAGTNGAAGTLGVGGTGAGRAGADGTAGTSGAAGAGGVAAGAPTLSVCPNCKSIFDGATLDGWTQVPANSWTIVDGAMHSLGTARGFIYTNSLYGSFRFIFTSRLVKDPASHLPCVLFLGDSPSKDALAALQVQPPNGYMWDYRTNSPTANKSPDRFETRFGHPAVTDAEWSQCEMLANATTGTMRFACCQLTGATTCKASEIVDFKDPTAGLAAPLAFQVHNAGMIEEFKDVYVESPVADPANLLTTR